MTNEKYPRYKAEHAAGKNLDFATRCIHGGQYADPYTGAVMVPIYATSTYKQEAPGVNRGFEYAREHNPTREALERALTDLDGGTRSFSFASGLAAMATIFDSLPAGSHIIASDDLYGGSYRMLDRVRKNSANIEASFVDMSDVANIEQAIRPNTRILWVETPTNPFLKLADLDALAKVAKKHKLLSVVDNTFATAWAQRPLEYGHDMVLYSLTKYMNGHSDMIGGAVVVGDNPDYVEKLAFLQKAIGSILGPFDSYLALRGLKTLDLRLQRQNESAQKIAEWLEKHPKIEKVYYPGLPSHPQHELAKRQNARRRRHCDHRHQGRIAPDHADTVLLEALRGRRKPWRRRKPDRPSGHHDSRFDTEGSARGEWHFRRPRAPVGRH